MTRYYDRLAREWGVVHVAVFYRTGSSERKIYVDGMPERGYVRRLSVGTILKTKASGVRGGDRFVIAPDDGGGGYSKRFEDTLRALLERKLGPVKGGTQQAQESGT